MPNRPETLKESIAPEATDTTIRKEDYKAYTERDIDEGWPYSDDQPGTEEERLQDNRPYAAEEEAPVTSEAEGFHIEEAEAPVIDADEADEKAVDEVIEEIKDDEAATSKP